MCYFQTSFYFKDFIQFPVTGWFIQWINNNILQLKNDNNNYKPWKVMNCECQEFTVDS